MGTGKNADDAGGTAGRRDGADATGRGRVDASERR